MNLATKTYKQAQREMKLRIVENSQRLLDKQFALAEGCQYLMVVKSYTDDSGKKRKGKPEVVTDEETIREYLDGKLDGLDDEYYFITTERPDARTLDSLLDRAFGKARQSMDLTSGDRPLGSNLDFSKLTDEQLRELHGIITAATRPNPNREGAT